MIALSNAIIEWQVSAHAEPEDVAEDATAKM